MAKRIRSRRHGHGVSASELAQIGVCERLVLFEHRRGERHTAQQLQDLARGRDAHERFHQQGQVEGPRRGRCFVATLVFGESPETQVLRDFRDKVMRPSASGRRLIVAYYRVAPTVCRLLMQRPGVIHVVRCHCTPWFGSRHVGLTLVGFTMNDEDIVVGSIVVLVVLVVLVVWEAARQWRWHAEAARRSTWPAQLHDARLVYSERLFRTEGAVPISARVDRVYRLRSGQLVLLELKTRSSDRDYLSDVIELSAQRVALHGQTGEPVAEHAWVIVQRGAAGLESFCRVKLLSTDGVHRLLQHRNDVLAGRVAPMFTRAAGVCCRCQYLNKCERAATSASLHALRRRAGD